MTNHREEAARAILAEARARAETVAHNGVRLNMLLAADDAAVLPALPPRLRQPRTRQPDVQTVPGEVGGRKPLRGVTRRGGLSVRI